MLPALPHTMWRAVLCDRKVWCRALRIGLPVGFVQVAVNQGDHWLAGTVTTALVLKTLASPTISTGIALVASLAPYREKTKQNTP